MNFFSLIMKSRFGKTIVGLPILFLLWLLLIGSDDRPGFLRAKAFPFLTSIQVTGSSTTVNAYGEWVFENQPGGITGDDSVNTSARIDTLTLGDDIDNVIGIIDLVDAGGGTLRLTTNGSDQFLVTGASGGVDFDAAFTATTVTSDGGVAGTTITGTGKISTTVTTEQLRLNYDATNYLTVTVADDGLTDFVTVDPDGDQADITFNPDGNVGIGTANPGADLDVTFDVDDAYSSTALSVNGLKVFNNSTTTNSVATFFFGSGSGNTAWASINVLRQESNKVGMTFQVDNGSTYEAVRIDNTGDVGIGTTTPDTKLDVNGAITQETYVVRKHVVLTGATDNNATNIFTITTTDETGSADGGAYSVTVHVMGNEGIAASGATNVSSVSLLAHWTRAMVSAGTGSNSAITEVSESASVDLGSGAIGAVTLTVTETSEFVQQVLLQIDTSGGVFDGWAIVELVYSDFTTPPVIASN